MYHDTQLESTRATRIMISKTSTTYYKLGASQAYSAQRGIMANFVNKTAKLKRNMDFFENPDCLSVCMCVQNDNTTDVYCIEVVVWLSIYCTQYTDYTSFTQGG